MAIASWSGGSVTHGRHVAFAGQSGNRETAAPPLPAGSGTSGNQAEAFEDGDQPDEAGEAKREEDSGRGEILGDPDRLMALRA